MRKLVVGALGIALLVGAAPLAAAEGPVKTKHAIDIQMQGRIDIGTVYRSQGFNYLYWGPCLPAPATQQVGPGDVELAQGRRISPVLVDDRGSVFLIDPQISLGFQATLPKNVIGYVELATPFYIIGDEGGHSEINGSNFSYPYSSSRRSPYVEQAYIELRDFILEDSGLDVRVGITDYALDFRGNGNAFLIDVQNAENPFLSATGAQQYLIHFAGTNTPTWDMGAGDTRIDPGPFGRDMQDAAGVLARYATEDKGIFAADVYVFDIMQGYEGHRDDFVAGSSVSIYFDEDRRLGKVTPTFLVMVNDGNSALYTMGGGAQAYPLDSYLGEKVLELYGEAYVQTGTYAKNVDVLAGPASSPYPQRRFESIDQKDAYALYVGARLGAPRVNQQEVVEGDADAAAYDYFGSLEPYADVSYCEVSGDSKADSDKNSNFVSLENNNSSLIVESAYWGLDIDTNYRAVRAELGFYPYKAWKLAGMYGYFEYQNNNHVGTVDNHAGRTYSKIGDEIDLTLTWEYSTHVKLRAGTGFLFDARALGTTQGVNLSVFQMVLDF